MAGRTRRRRAPHRSRKASHGLEHRARREPMPRYKRGRDRIADIVLERITRFARDLAP
jgi:hypothetical protein